MIEAAVCKEVFSRCISEYHIKDNVDQEINNPYPGGSIEGLLYNKCWIDTVQWHYEDLIRDPEIDPHDGMALKRLIDASNQRRTDMVEAIDDWFLMQYKDVNVDDNATINTESPAWVIDRLSILALKIYHMQEQVDRQEVDEDHVLKAKAKLEVLMEQQTDLYTS